MVKSDTQHYNVALLIVCLMMMSGFNLAQNKAWGEEKVEQKVAQQSSEKLRYKIIGDQEAPAVRYFVPWKSPQQDEMLPITTPAMKPLQVLDPHELRREIDYHSERQAIEHQQKQTASENNTTNNDKQ